MKLVHVDDEYGQKDQRRSTTTTGGTFNSSVFMRVKQAREILPSGLCRAEHHLAPVWIAQGNDDIVGRVGLDAQATQVLEKLCLILDLEIEMREVRVRPGWMSILGERGRVMDGELQAVLVDLPVDVPASASNLLELQACNVLIEPGRGIGLFGGQEDAS